MELNMSEWYTASQAAERLTRNSGKPIQASYPRKLAEYNKVKTYKLSDRNVLYWRADIDAYIVEERGEKSGRAKRQQATPKVKKQKHAA